MAYLHRPNSLWKKCTTVFSLPVTSPKNSSSVICRIQNFESSETLDLPERQRNRTSHSQNGRCGDTKVMQVLIRSFNSAVQSINVTTVEKVRCTKEISEKSFSNFRLPIWCVNTWCLTKFLPLYIRHALFSARLAASPVPSAKSKSMGVPHLIT